MTGNASGIAAVSTRCTPDLLYPGPFPQQPFQQRQRREDSATGDADDGRLVQRCIRRNPAALREVVRRCQPAPSRFLGQMRGCPEDTEEVLREVFLRVWQQAHQFRGRASFSTRLHRIASKSLPMPMTASGGFPKRLWKRMPGNNEA